jgi:hypothetical protein
MSGIVNKVKEALHSSSSDKTTDTHTHGHNTATGTHGASHTTGTHNTHGVPEGTAGPHSGRVANAADPRVDSDLDRSRNAGINPSGTATTGTHTGTHTGTSGLHTGTGAHTGSSGLHSTGAHTGTSGLHSSTGTGAHTGATGLHSTGANRGLDGPATKTDGPHSNNLLNKADPRVDSDRDHSHNLGANPHGTATTGSGAQTGAHTGAHTGTSGIGSHNTHGVPEGTAGPHSNRGLNAADPRVDSDLDRSRNAGLNPSGTATTGTAGGAPGIGGFGTDSNTHGTHGTTGLTGSHGTHNTTGTHGTSGLTGSHGTTGTHNTTGLTGSHAPGPAPNTAGPHKSDALNKVDPRVDSDLDGSKTVGGDKTYTR